MKKLYIIFAVFFAAAASAQTAWRFPLYLDAGCPAPKRTEIEVRNNTNAEFSARAVEVSAKDLGIVGEKRSGLRVVSAEDKELLFALYPDSQIVSDKTKIIIPIDCAANSAAKVTLYHGSRSALDVPDYYYVFDKQFGFEGGDKDFADSWSYRNSKDFPKNALSEKYAKSGKKSLYVERGFPNNFLDFKFAMQVETPKTREARMFPKVDRANWGDTMELSAWVKAENAAASKDGGVTIAAVFNFKDGKFKIFKAEKKLSGTTDWEKISLDVKVPEGAETFNFCTVTNIESGGAYFDDFRALRKYASADYSVKVGAAETLKLAVEKAAKDWEAPKDEFNLRVTASFFNLSKKSTGNAVGTLPINIIAKGNFPARDFAVYKNGKPVPCSIADPDLVFPIDPIPAETEAQYNIYIRENRKNRRTSTTDSRQASYILSDLVTDVKNSADASGFEEILNSKANLLKNPSFEEPLISAWMARTSEKDNAFTTQIAQTDGGIFGKKGVRIKFNENFKPKTDGYEFPGGASSKEGQAKRKQNDMPKDYYGLRQPVAVEAGRNYIAILWARALGEPQSISIPRMFIINGKNNKYAVGGVRSNGEWVSKSKTIEAAEGDRVWVDVMAMGKCNAIFDGAFFGESAKAEKFSYDTLSDTQGEYFSVWSVNPIIKVFDFFAPPSKSSPASISLAKNEYENIQFAVRASAGKSLEISAPAPVLKTDASVKLPAPATSVAGYVICDAPNAYRYFLDVKYHERCVPNNQIIERYPDPLVTQGVLELNGGETQSVWLNFRADKNARAGEYAGVLEFKENGKVVKSVPYTVLVRNFALPEKASLAAIFDSRGTGSNGSWRETRDEPGITSKFYDRETLQEFLVKYRASVDMPQRYVFKMKDGRLSADFSEFDKFCELSFDKLGARLMYLPQISSFSFANRFSPIKYEGEDGKIKYVKPYAENVENKDLGKFSPEYVEMLKAQTKIILDHVKEKGWQNNFLWYSCDEPHTDVKGIADMLNAYCKILKSVEPSVRIYSSTWAYNPLLSESINVWGMNMSAARTPEELKIIDARKDGKLFTTDGNYCINTPYSAQERIMSIYCYAGGFTGYEYWGVDWYMQNPFVWGIHRDRISMPGPKLRYRNRYPNGDGYFVYSGEIIGRKEIFPSVRFESVRDGQEDFEYYKILERLAEEKNDAGAKKTLEKVKAMAVYPNAGGTRSVELLPDPDVVTKLRDEVAEQIERLSGGAK